MQECVDLFGNPFFLIGNAIGFVSLIAYTFNAHHWIGRLVVEEETDMANERTQRALKWYGIEWPALTGTNMLEKQHQALIDRGHQLRLAIVSGHPVDQVNAIIDSLIRDVVEHFRYEEALLATGDHSKYEMRAAQHRQLVDSAATMVAKFRAGTLAIGDLFQFLSAELLGSHILRPDRDELAAIGVAQ